MSMEHLAELLNVDEVRIEHGPKGYGLSIRLDDTWMNTTIDHAELKKSVDGHRLPKMHGVAKKLVHLTDTLLHGVSRDTIAKQMPLPTRLSMPVQEYEDYGRQLRRYDTPAPQLPPPPAASPEPASTIQMASRFHAIVAELSKL